MSNKSKLPSNMCPNACIMHSDYYDEGFAIRCALIPKGRCHNIEECHIDKDFLSKINDLLKGD